MLARLALERAAEGPEWLRHASISETASRTVSERGAKADCTMELDQRSACLFVNPVRSYKEDLIYSALATKVQWPLIAGLSSGAAPAHDAPGSWLTAVSSPVSQLGLTGMICELF